MDRRALLNDPIETQYLILDGRQSTMWTALPAFITKVNMSQMTVECQPTIQGQITDANNVSTFVSLPVLIHVPIIFPSGGGFTLTFPIAVGDECLVIFSSRAIDSWWQSGGVQKAIEGRMHDLSDGFCLPGPKSIPNVVPDISSTDVQLRNNSGSTFIGIKPNGNVQITAPTVNITGDLVVSGEVTSGLTMIPLSTHTHSGVTPGGGDSGPPLP